MSVLTRAKFPSELPMRKSARIAVATANLFCFVLGLSTQFSIHFVGELQIAEILLVCALPLLLIFGRRKMLRSDLKMIWVFMGLWLAAQMISDEFNHTALIDRARGEALIAFFGLDLLGMWLLLGGNHKRKLLYLAGLALGALAQVKLQPSETSIDYPWKFGYAWGTMLLTMLVSSFFYARGRHLISALLVLLLCGVNLLMNYRSPVLQMLIAFVIVYPIIPERFGRFQLLPKPGSFARVTVLTVFVVFAGVSAQSLVHYVTRAGLLSEESAEKNEAQSQMGSLLLGGRPEFVVGLRAALDAPLLGHGSWAQDFRYQEMLADLMTEYSSGGRSEAEAALEYSGSLIPTHSHIVGAWVYSGIMGLVFWAYVIWVAARSLIRLTVLRPAMAPIYAWLIITMLWDVGFSPFASTRRLTEGFLLVVMFDLLATKIPLRTNPPPHINHIKLRLDPRSRKFASFPR